MVSSILPKHKRKNSTYCISSYSFFEFIKAWNFHIVSALSFLVCNERRGNYSREEIRYVIVVKYPLSFWLTWKINWDWKNRFNNPSQNMVDNPLNKVPPRYKYWPSGAKSAAPEKQAKIIPVKNKKQKINLASFSISWNLFISMLCTKNCNEVCILRYLNNKRAGWKFFN